MQSSAGGPRQERTGAPARRRRVPWTPILRAIARTVGKAPPLSAESAALRSPSDPFRVLVTTMISPRTKDEVTDAAADRLLRQAATPQELARMGEGAIARLIFPAGFYRTKARHIRQAASELVSRHAGAVPANMAGLLELPGVGRKIANLVLSQGFGLDAICVDTHVHRISNRMGWVETSQPRQTEDRLRAILPRRHWQAINGLLVGFGKAVCTPLSPRCSTCPVSRYCARAGVSRSR